MNRVFTVLVIVAALIIAILFIGSSWLNTYLNSDAFRHEAETRAAAATGGTVEIKQIGFSIWSGVKLDGLATKLATPQGTVAAQVESLHCSYSLGALLRRQFEVNGVTAVKPEIVLTQEAPSSVATPPAPPAPLSEGSKPPTPGGNAPPFQFVLDGAKIRDGHLTIRDASGATKADLQGIQAEADGRGYYDGKDATGKLTIARVNLPQNLALTDFSTPFTCRPNAMTATPFSADAFSGKLTGSYTLPPDAPSTLEVDAKGIDLAQIARAANPDSPTTLTGTLALQSHWQGVETGTLAGEGDAQIGGGQLKGGGVLHDLGSVLHISTLDDPPLKSVTTHFQVANGTTHFNHLQIESDAFDITGEGVIKPDGGLNASLVLVLHGGVQALGGVDSIPFHVGGSVAHPSMMIDPGALLRAPKVEKTLNRAISHFFH